ncbi:MAG TPA: winged helix-turn-helix domain-containing protein, partial [Bryobacteraceae bacterium]|nr:winged helix-turn-helix domain-containing protein [Bryobacteraceae bacterium]
MDTSRKLVRFGAFEVDLGTGELRKHGLQLRLQEQPFQILMALIERPGEVVTREELVRLLWPDGTFVDFDRGLNAAVTRLRQALSDSAESPRYIDTVARRGYRLIASVSTESRSDVPVIIPRKAPARRWAA